MKTTVVRLYLLAFLLLTMAGATAWVAWSLDKTNARIADAMSQYPLAVPLVKNGLSDSITDNYLREVKQAISENEEMPTPAMMRLQREMHAHNAMLLNGGST